MDNIKIHNKYLFLGGDTMITISLCMIVKNEGKVLDRCLKSVYDLVDEIIIVDTGSSDNTKDIASKYTNLIYDYEWNNDFAAARNFAFSKATKEYIYTADADEMIDEVNRKKFMQLKKVLLPEIEIVQMLYLTDMRYNTTENYKRNLRPKIYKRLRNFTWINPIHETVRLEPVVFDSEIEILHMPTSNHSKRDLGMFRKIVEEKRSLNNKLHMMYARELYKSGSDNDLIKSRAYFEKSLNKPVMTKDDFDRAHESIAVLAKVYNIMGNNVGILSLVKYALFDFSFKESTRRIIEKFGKETTLSGGIHEIESYIKNRKDWNNQLSSELCLQIGIRLMEEEAYEESRKWFLRTIHKTVSMLDIDSSQVIPNRYLEILDSKKKVHI